MTGKLKQPKLDYIKKSCLAINTNFRDNDLVIFNLNGSHPDGAGKDFLKSLFSNLRSDIKEKLFIFQYNPKHLSHKLIPDGSLNENGLDNYVRFQMLNRLNEQSDYQGISDYVGLDETHASLSIIEGSHVRPAYIPSHFSNMDFWAFVGTLDKRPTYKDVYNKYINSEHWNQVENSGHLHTCEGCKIISKMKKDTVPTDSASWREITMLHYLTEMRKYLSSKVQSSNFRII